MVLAAVVVPVLRVQMEQVLQVVMVATDTHQVLVEHQQHMAVEVVDVPMVLLLKVKVVLVEVVTLLLEMVHQTLVAAVADMVVAVLLLVVLVVLV
jgi:hypothetical protein